MTTQRRVLCCNVSRILQRPKQIVQMAPIEPDLTTSNVCLLLTFSGYPLLVVGLTALILFDVLYNAHAALPPSQDARPPQDQS